MQECFVNGCDRDTSRVNSGRRNMCHGHYIQWLAGEPFRDIAHQETGGTQGACSVAECDRQKYAKHLCRRHYEKRRRDSLGECSFDSCERPQAYRQLCESHWRQLKRGEDLTPIQAPAMRRVSRKGYVWIKREDHPNAHGNGWLQEHTVVMSEKIGRPLIEGENVHHKNGIRHDNRPENLELWVTSQPAGQRPEDLLEWADEIIRRYRI